MTLTVGPITAPAGANLTTASPLQPGTVVDARVLQVLQSGLTRILIADVTLDVASTANLVAGSNVQLAVSQTPQGIQLAVVGQGTQSAALPVATSSNSGPAIPVQGIDGGRGSSVIAPGVSNTAPSATTISSSASPPVVASDPASAELSPAAILRSVVASATETAATRQASLAPLFANVDAVAAARALPPAVAAAAERLLALRPDLGTTLQGDDLKVAFNNSGLFLESALKTAALTGSAAPSSAVPDLKAALLVLRQVLSLWSDASPSTVTPMQSSVAESMTPEAVTPVQSSDESAATPELATNNAAANANPTKPPTGIVAESVQTNTSSPGEPLATASAALAEAESSVPAGAIAAIQRAVMLKAGDVLAAELVSVSDAPSIASDVAQRSLPMTVDTPPPPWRGAAPSAQPISSATLAPLAPDANIARVLLSETDAALARQTLHQIASLPDRLDINSANTAANLSNVSSGPRWSFEIPFATPQGTAVAQFEISEDGGGETAQGSSQKVWRARFTIDVEPTGPVHARVAMMTQPNGTPKTSVRLWAERSETQIRLQSRADQLVQALRGANLDPETILVGVGKPPASTVPSGRFLDRAS